MMMGKRNVAVLHNDRLVRLNFVSAQWFKSLIFPLRMSKPKLLHSSIASGCL